MNFAIRKLEEVEGVLKQTIHHLSEKDVDASVMKGHLEEVQTAILVLNEIKPIINIGQIMALKKKK